MIMEIKFIESHSFLGEEMTMVVNGNHHRLELNRVKNDYRICKQRIIELQDRIKELQLINYKLQLDR